MIHTRLRTFLICRNAGAGMSISECYDKLILTLAKVKNTQDSYSRLIRRKIRIFRNDINETLRRRRQNL